MTDSSNPQKTTAPREGSGFHLQCHKCGQELPLLHPHIMVERTDEDENLICEWCWEKFYRGLQ